METQTTTMHILEILFKGTWLRKNEIEMMLDQKKPRTVENAILQLKKVEKLLNFCCQMILEWVTTLQS